MSLNEPLIMFIDNKVECNLARGGCRRARATGNPMSTEGNPDQKVTRPRLDPDAREHIGAHLQIIFAEIEGQPIPDEQVDLLLTLRRVERELGRRET